MSGNGTPSTTYHICLVLLGGPTALILIGKVGCTGTPPGNLCYIKVVGHVFLTCPILCLPFQVAMFLANAFEAADKDIQHTTINLLLPKENMLEGLPERPS